MTSAKHVHKQDAQEYENSSQKTHVAAGCLQPSVERHGVVGLSRMKTPTQHMIAYRLHSAYMYMYSGQQTTMFAEAASVNGA